MKRCGYIFQLLRNCKVLANCLVLTCCSFISTAQTPAEILAWLKKNITVYYLANPNTDKPDIRKISPETIAKAENGIIFGKTDNNGMERNAQLLISLFKEKSKDPKDALLTGKDGDQKFQESIYYAMQLTGKPIAVFFINDVTTSIQYKYVAQYKFYLIGNVMREAVWPGTFPWQSPYAGAIAVGEFAAFPLQNYKEMFVAMAAQTGLGDFAPAKRTSTDLIKLTTEEELPYTAGTNDIRRITNQGIANGFSFYFSELLRNRVEKWKSKGGYFYLTKTWSRSAEDPTVYEEIPKKYTLTQKILERNKKLPGYILDEKNALIYGILVGSITAVYSDYYFYIDNEQRFRYALLNDFHIGEICYEFMKRFGIKKFVEVMKYNNNEIVKVVPGEKLACLFQNMCLVMLEGKPVKNDQEIKAAGGKPMFGLALFDYFGYGDIRTPKGTFTQGIQPEFAERTGGWLTNAGDVFIYIMAYYATYWQNILRDRIKNSSTSVPVMDVIADALNLK